MSDATGATTIDQALAAAASRLAAAGIAQARLDARVLAIAALGLTREALLAHGDRRIEPAAAARFDDYVARRLRGEPVARILGRKEFWSLEFEISPETLVPRPESETVIDAALAVFPASQATLAVLDLGTGSGCLLLAVLSERPRAHGLGIDISEGAIAVAQRNARKLGLAARSRFAVADFTGGLAGVTTERFDLVLSNPPYIAEGEIAGLDREVAQYEPRAALAGGADGLAAYRALAPRLAALLTPYGHALLEIGQGQAAAVSAIMAGHGLDLRAQHTDLAGISRVLDLALAQPQKKWLTSRD